MRRSPIAEAQPSESIGDGGIVAQVARSVNLRAYRRASAQICFKESDSLEIDLACDSLRMVEIVMQIEEHFGIDVPDEAAEEIRTVGEMVDGVSRLLGGA